MTPEQYNTFRRTGELYTRMLDALCDLDNFREELEGIMDDVRIIRNMLQEQDKNND